MLKCVSICFFAVILMSCGNKGALYLPEKNIEVEQASSSN
ncbi:LPS translocon maturation chaperone LptM [Marinomonas dokdonensis]